MTGKRLALFFLLILALDLLHVDAWRRRRRRRRRRRVTFAPPTTPKPTTLPTTPKPTTLPTTPKPTPAPCNDSMPPAGENIKWANKWHQSFIATCRNGFFMSQWDSRYRKCQEDRIHKFRCRYLVPTGHSTCLWSPLLNVANQSFGYRCPNNGFIAAVGSYFNKVHKDRRIILKCCHVNGFQRKNCHTTLSQNLFGGELNFKVPQYYVMTGVGSYHSVASTVICNYSDRRWKFEICQMGTGTSTLGKK